MKSFSSKISYLFRSVAKFPFETNSLCPNCGARPQEKLDAKYLVTQLHRCGQCALLFRTPTDTEAFSEDFYNRLYAEGTTTEYPAPTELTALKQCLFRGTEQDASGYIQFLNRHQIAAPMRLLDFGCSWGYYSYQFSNAGFETYSYEIARNRRNFGITNLGVQHIDDMYDIAADHPLAGTFDCFFSAHVLEHVPSPSRVIELAWACLKPGGAFVSFTPNGCESYRRNKPESWSRMWGEVHPNFLDDVFFEKHFANSRRTFEACDGGDVAKNYELGFIAWKDREQRTF